MRDIDDREGDVTSDGVPDSNAESQANGTEGTNARR